MAFNRVIDVPFERNSSMTSLIFGAGAMRVPISSSEAMKSIIGPRREIKRR